MMNEGVLKRRSIYKLGKAMPVGEDAVERMPFGGIVEEPPAKPTEDIASRVRVVR